MDSQGHFQHDVLQIFRSFTCFNNIPHKVPKDKAKEAEKPEKQAGCSLEKGEKRHEETSGWKLDANLR